MFLGLPDSHSYPLITSTNPASDPDHSITKKNLAFYCFVYSIWLFTSVPDPDVLGPPGSGSVRQMYGSEDPDPHQEPYQNVPDPQNWFEPTWHSCPPAPEPRQLSPPGQVGPAHRYRLRRNNSITLFTKFYLLSNNYIYAKKAWLVGRGKLQNCDFLWTIFGLQLCPTAILFMRKHRTGIVITVVPTIPTFCLTPYLCNAKFLQAI